MTDTTQTPGPIQPLTSFPSYGGFYPSFPFQGLNSQFGASMSPFGGGYGGWGMPQQYGMGGGWPSLFGGGTMPQQFGGIGGMGGMGGGGFPFGGGMMYAGGSPTFNEAAGAFPVGMGVPFGSTPGQGAQQSQAGISDGFGLGATGRGTPFSPQQTPQQPQQPSAPMQPPAYGASGFGPGAPGAVPDTNQYAPVGSAAWAQQNHVDPQGVQSMLARGPWNSQQLDQAYAINPGLAAYMYREINPIAGQQFMQDHGFANAPGAQTMLNGAGRNFLMDYDPTYGAQARDAQGHRLMFGATTNGTPYSYEMRARGDPMLLRWQQTGQGAPPPGITMYSQFGGG